MGVFPADADRVLVVDDEAPVRNLLTGYLAKRGFATAAAADAEEALCALDREHFDLVMSDVRMPGMNGLALLSEIRRRHPAVGVLLLTGCGDVDMAVEAMKSGALDYVLKPINLASLETSIRSALDRGAFARSEADRVRRLEQTVLEQTVELQELLGHLEETSESTLDALVTALDARERETHSHSRRVAEYTVHLAGRMGVEGAELESLRRGSLLHDIGKIGIPDHILLKPGPLTDDEWRHMRRHPQIGYWILNGIERLRPAAQIVLSHHERFDGLGYPQNLKKDEIPLGARIFTLMDTLDAITSERPYHRGESFDAASEEIAANAGGQFDPLVVEQFLAVPATVWPAIRNFSLASNSRAITNLPQLVVHECQLNSY